MASNLKQLREAIKSEWLEFLMMAVKDGDHEILQTASNEFAVPVVDSEGGEHYVVITIKIPTGSRDGEPYDGYAVAEDFKMRQESKRAKQAEKERKATERASKGSK